jgi:hypothetical protein
MLMVPTSVVWFSLFQRMNPWADPRWQFSKNQRTGFDVELRFSQKNNVGKLSLIF